jgi:hypothetical protein
MMATVTVLLAFEVNGANHGLGPLRCRDGTGKRLHAAAILAIRQNDQGFASALFLHQRVGGKKIASYNVVPAKMPSMAVIPPMSGIAAYVFLLGQNSSLGEKEGPDVLVLRSGRLG